MNWKIGKIKFYSEEKKFGYLIDGTGHWDDKEYRFDNNLVSNYIFKNDDFVCIKFEKKENKKIVKSIKLVDRFFFDEYFEELDKYFRYELIEYLDKNTKKQIDELAETYRGNLDEIKKNLTFKEEKINIEEYLEDFRIELKIFKNNKPGDDAFINILYKISHPKFEYIPIADFKTNILSHHGLIDIFEIEKDFVEKEQENYLALMPIFFNDFKNSLKKNYYISKSRKHPCVLMNDLKKYIKSSISEIGFQNTIENIDNIFNQFIEFIKDDNSHEIYYSIRKNALLNNRN